MIVQFGELLYNCGVGPGRTQNKRSVLFKSNLVGLRREFVLLGATGWEDQYTTREGSWSCPKALGANLSCFLTWWRCGVEPCILDHTQPGIFKEVLQACRASVPGVSKIEIEAIWILLWRFFSTGGTVVYRMCHVRGVSLLECIIPF